ncbi:MAG: insulinase family protein [Firmicutes bacterium]|nr:insulinase family protein [Bacillota bacterium]
MTNSFTLSCGMRVLVEPMPYLRSVACGLWVDSGSAAETDRLAGASHFIEHMLFKGTPTRDARTIASAMESVGGMMNAFTSKEMTCFYTRCLDEDFRLALELLADIYLNSLFDAEEFAREKNVIIEEIKMGEDDPEDVVSEQFTALLWPQQSYGRPVIGSVETVSAMTADQLRAYQRRQYTPQNSVLTVTGNVSAEQVQEAAEALFAGFRAGAEAVLQPPQLVTAAKGGYGYTYKDIEQNHICLGFAGVDCRDADYYAVQLLTNLLGGGASSRLFQEVREKRGLCYSVYSYPLHYRPCGYQMTYASTRPENTRQLIDVVLEQINDILHNSVDEKELHSSRQQLKGSLLLGMENSGSVMNRLGKSMLTLGRVRTVDEAAAALDALTAEDVMKAARRIFRPGELLLSVVGAEDPQLDVKQLF